MKEPARLLVGDMVRIRVGPFQAFTRRVQEVDELMATVKVKVEVFGRPQPIELRFADVQKISFTEEK